MTSASVYFVVLLIPLLDTAEYRCDYSYIPYEGWFKAHRLPTDPDTAKRICIREGQNWSESHFVCHKKAGSAKELNACGTKDNEYKLDKRTGHCYKFHRFRNTWSSAKEICAHEGGNLAVINSETEANIIKDLFKWNPTFSDLAYVGLKILSGWDWKTIYGYPLSMSGYDKWALGEPMEATYGELCGTVNRNGLLYSNTCDQELLFVCEKKIQNCEDKYNMHDNVTGNCYKFHRERRKFYDSDWVCIYEGGRLAVINNENEAQVIRDLFAKYPYYTDGQFIGDAAHIGIYRNWHGEDWVTAVNKTPLLLSGYNKWAPGKPQNIRQDKNCVVVSRNALMSNEDCELERAYICERKFNKTCGKYNYAFDNRTGGCYKFYETKTDWYHARKNCHLQLGHLIIINNETEAQVVRDLFKSVRTYDYTGYYVGDVAFIGVSQHLFGKDWRSIDGKQLYLAGYTRWAPGEPNNYDKDEYCADVSREAWFIDNKCYREMPFICEKRKESCDEYNHFDITENCYKFHLFPNTWSRALEICTTEGATLAVINNEDEAQTIREIFTTFNRGDIPEDFWKNSAYLGIKRDVHGREWQAVDGDELSMSEYEYDGWAPGEPNNANGDEYCVVVQRDGLLYDEPCDRQHLFICEKQYEDCI